jgi:hypothetical protein
MFRVDEIRIHEWHATDYGPRETTNYCVLIVKLAKEVNGGIMAFRTAFVAFLLREVKGNLFEC